MDGASPALWSDTSLCSSDTGIEPERYDCYSHGGDASLAPAECFVPCSKARLEVSSEAWKQKILLRLRELLALVRASLRHHSHSHFPPPPPPRVPPQVDDYVSGYADGDFDSAKTVRDNFDPSGCPAGQQQTIGARTPLDCEDCAVGRFSNAGEACQDCPSGLTTEGEGSVSGDCGCAVNTYYDTGSSSCVPCPSVSSGMERTSPHGSTDVSDCTCPEGYR